MDFIEVIHDRIQWWTLVMMIMNIHVT